MTYIYCRISTDKQSDESLERQEEICRQWVSEPITVVHEIGSGNNQNRPELQKILRQLQPDDYVCIRDNSRLARNMLGSLTILNTITEKGAHLICDGKVIEPDNPQDIFTFNVHSAFSDFQRSIQAQKAKEGQQKMLSEGDWIFCSTLFGYDLVKHGKNKIVSVIEEEAKIIRFVFEKYSSGWSVKKLLGELQGLPLQRQSNFTLKKISRILQQPIYCGFYPDSTIDNKVLPRYTRSELETHLVKSNYYTPIIEESLFWTCFDRYREVTPTHSRPWQLRWTKHALSGIIRCPSCHKGIAHFTKMGDVYCTEDHSPDCQTKWRTKFDSRWLETIMTFCFYLTFLDGSEIGSFFDEKQQELFQDKSEISEAISQITNSLSEVQKKIDRLIESISDGIISSSDAKKRMESLKSDQQSLLDRKTSLEQDLRQIEVDVDALLELSSEEVIGTFPNNERDYFKKFLKYGYAYKDRIEIEYMNGKHYTIPRGKRHNHTTDSVTVTSTYQDDSFQFVYTTDSVTLVKVDCEPYDRYIEEILKKGWDLVNDNQDK